MTPTSTGGQLIYKRTHFTWHRHIPGMKSRLSLWSTNRYRGHDQSFVRVAALYVHADGSAIVDASLALSSKFRFRVHRSKVGRVSHMRCISLLFVATFERRVRKVSFISPYISLFNPSSPFNNRNGNRWRDHVVKALYPSMKFTRAPRASQRESKYRAALSPPPPSPCIRSWLINRALYDARNYERGLRAATNQP